MKDKTTAGMLGIFLGVFGTHRFYLGETGSGCGLLLLGLFLPPIPMLLGFIEGLQLLGMSQEEFDARFNQGPPVTSGVASDVPLGMPVGRAPRSAAPWYRNYRPRTSAEREQVVLAAVYDSGGAITPAELALATRLSLQQSRDVLREMELLGVCQTQYDPDSGLPRYLFPELTQQTMTGDFDERLEDPLDRRF